nr:f-box/lrr-repeat protein 2 [Quercus suber]
MEGQLVLRLLYLRHSDWGAVLLQACGGPPCRSEPHPQVAGGSPRRSSSEQTLPELEIEKGSRLAIFFTHPAPSFPSSIYPIPQRGRAGRAVLYRPMDHEPSPPTLESLGPPSPFEERPRKLKGRARLLRGLQRISSSPSVPRLGSSHHAYNGAGRGSISCISLRDTTQPLHTSSLAQTFNQELIASTPGAHVQQQQQQQQRERPRAVSDVGKKTSVPLPNDLRSTPKAGLSPALKQVDEDYFSRPLAPPRTHRRKDFSFWRDLPSEMKMEVLTYLDPKEIVRSSLVSRAWHEMCFDGQLWGELDTADFYQQIPADALAKIITSAGPFVRDLNLRGCVQLRERWHAQGLSDVCTNLENFSLEGCRIDRTSIHSFLYANRRLVHINLSGLAGATNSAMKIIAANCPRLEHLNVSWCNNINTRGLKRIIESCAHLRDLRAGEIRGWDDVEIMELLFERNSLERLVLMHCDSLTDESLAVLIEGRENEVDHLTGRPIVPPRRFKHLDLTRCRTITDRGVRTFINNVPEIEGLQLSQCHTISDTTVKELVRTTPLLTHLDIEESESLTNVALLALADSPCAKRLQHLCISHCENLGDSGMIPVLKSCTNLRSLEMDNTRISDLVLTEAAAMVRHRIPRALRREKTVFRPATGLRLVAYDCQNVTWTGVREILSRNAEIFVSTHALELPPLEKTSRPVSAAASAEHLPSTRPPSPRIHIVRTTSYPAEVIQLKCFYTYQPTVEEHTKRVMRGDFLSARRLERKWAEFMIAQEEAGAMGAGVRRRRRRAREAQMMHADEEDGDGGVTGLGVGGGRRRRARSGGCAVMNYLGHEDIYESLAHDLFGERSRKHGFGAWGKMVAPWEFCIWAERIDGISLTTVLFTHDSMYNDEERDGILSKTLGSDDCCFITI